MTPTAAARPNRLPPVRSTACACWMTVPERSESVPSVPGAPPRTSTPATAPPGAKITVHPVRPTASVKCPTDTPSGSAVPSFSSSTYKFFGNALEDRHLLSQRFSTIGVDDSDVVYNRGRTGNQSSELFAGADLIQ